MPCNDHALKGYGDLSCAVEDELVQSVRAEPARRVREEHADAFAAYEERIARDGVSIQPIWRRTADIVIAWGTEKAG